MCELIHEYLADQGYQVGPISVYRGSQPHSYFFVTGDIANPTHRSGIQIVIFHSNQLIIHISVHSPSVDSSLKRCSIDISDPNSFQQLEQILSKCRNY